MSRTAESRPTDPFSGIQLLSDDAFQSLGSMEAIEWEAPAPEKLRLGEVAPGIIVAVALAILAIGLQNLMPASLPLGAAVIAMLLGIAVRNTLPFARQTSSGCRLVVAHLIPVAIVLVGAGLDLRILATEGFRFLGFILATLILSAAGSLLIARFAGWRHSTALLVGAGTGICGSSAILAVAPVIDADEDDILLSVGAINLIGLAAMFACIGVAPVFALTATDFGILTGTTIHAVPTVAAAAFDHSPEAGQVATLVKMGRVALLVPFVVLVAIFRSREKGAPSPGRGRTRMGKLFAFVPWFVWGFAATALLGTLGLIPDLVYPDTKGVIGPGLHLSGPGILGMGGKLLLTLAMAAIGLQVGVKAMLKTGGQAVLLAALAWGFLFAVILTVLVVR